MNYFYRYKAWIAPIVFFLIASVWLWLIWTPAPAIIHNGDAGNVSSIIASSLHPERFLADPVFSDHSTTNFYLSISVPLTRALSFFTNDIGQAYILLIWPILFFQMLGFYFLGLRLFKNRGWAFLLAVISIPPVFVFAGELWGQLSEPLSRSYFGAVFPYLLLICLKENNKKFFPYWVMILCGLSVYIYPVSPPSIAFACWLGLVSCKPSERTWTKQISLMMGAGLVFLAISLPFMLLFFKVFPSSASLVNNNNTSIAAQYVSQAAGDQFYDVLIVLKMLIRGGVDNPHAHGSWGLSWLVWIAGILGLLFISNRSVTNSYQRRFIIFFTLGLLLSSIAFVWIDQTIAEANHRYPAQIDLVRNIRFIIPLLLIGAVRLLVELNNYWDKKYNSVLAGIGLILGLTWWSHYPTPITTLSKEISLFEKSTPQNKSINPLQEIVTYIKHLPPNSKILVLPQTSSIQTASFAIRYAAFQPIVYLQKDLNFLSYSGHSDRILQWQKVSAQLTALNEAKLFELPQLLDQLMKQENTHYILVFTPELKPSLKQVLNKQYHHLITKGDFSLFSVSDKLSKDHG